MRNLRLGEAASLGGGIGRVLCVAGVLGAMALAACGGGSGGGGGSATPSGGAGGAGGAGNADAPVDTTKTTLRLGLGQEPPTWDFIKTPDTTAILQVVGLNVVESLMEQTDAGKLVPLLASKYEVSKDRRLYDFTIREATFHDGSPLTAEDVVYSLEQAQHRPQPSLAYKQVTAIKAVDSHTVRVTLKRPSQSFLGGMATAAGLIIKNGSAGTLAKGAVGTGPFVFTSYRPGVGLTLKRFDKYWGQKPVLKTVIIQYIKDVTSMVNQFKAGQLDMIEPGPGSPQVDALKADSRYKVLNVHAAEKVYLALNGKDPAFKDQRVREAIASTIDRKAMIDTTLGGAGTPICVIASPGEAGYTKECPYPQDPERAKQLVQEAGVNPTIKLTHVTEWGADAPNLIRSFLKPIGVDLKFVGVDWPTYVKKVLGDPPSYQTTFLSGPEEIDAWRCPGWFLETCDRHVDQLLDEADAAPTREQYESLRKQALLAFAKDAYLIPYQAWDKPNARDAAIAGVSTTVVPMSELDLRHLHWTKTTG
jgi:peptide/nickel transport system substrate-binding protein